ncbi:MAG: hypothetical protein JSS56_02810 [Proteobacteria bacterium]|nr:hypothetical protein [Pseudomonadota bacterium]
MTATRRMGITVERPQDGSYYWVIHEDVHCDGRYETLERAPHACATYALALAEGYGMLQRINGRKPGLDQLHFAKA